MRIATFVFSLILAVGVKGQPYAYETVDSQTIVRLLGEGLRQKKGTNLPVFFANQFKGRPYVAHTLELFDDERPIVNTRQLDCTTLIETVTALTLCVQQRQVTFADYLKMLTLLRYRDGKLRGYTSRLHYFSDWIVNKEQMGFVKEIQAPNPPFSALQQLAVNYMSRHPQSYKALKAHPEYIPVIRKHEQALTGKKFRYIPQKQISNTRLLRQTVKEGDIIAIVTTRQGLDIAHLGLAVWQNDGLHLLNASMLHKKVVLESMTLRQYLQKHPTFVGIRIIRINQHN